jgi:Cupin-like domain
MSDATDPPGDDGGIPVRWRRWAAVSLMRGTPVTEVLNALEAEGFDDRDAVLLCASLYESPALDGGRWLAGQLAKLSSVLAIREQLAALAGGPAGVERRSGVSGEEFLDRYYASNEPVVLTDVCDTWSAAASWSFDYLADVLGSVEAVVEAGAAAGKRPDQELMPFTEFAARADNPVPASAARGLASADRTAGVCLHRDLRLAADNRLLATEAATPLWDDFALDPRYLEADPGRTHATLRIGAAGTVAPLRHELRNVLSCQVDGWQHVIMIPAPQLHRVYNNVSVYSDVDPVAPDLARYPQFAGATQFHLDLGPGHALFIPVGWWYHVECTEPSIGVDLTNFAFLNEFPWTNPEFRL